MSKTRFIKVAAIITIIAAGLGTGAFFLQRSYQYNYADIRSVAVNGDAKQLEAVIKHGADVNATDEDGRPVLFWAMRKPGNKDNILILINNGADVNFLYNQVSPLTMALTNLTDNTVVSSLPAILDQANEKGIPVFGSEIEQVKIGCLAAEGIDYVSLGKDTGKMAAKILKGEVKAEDMEYQLLTESNLYVNEKVAENLGITVPDSMNDRAVETFSEISEG